MYQVAVKSVCNVQQESEGPSATENQRPRPKLTASNSGADIMLGLETEEGQSAEVEIDTADQEELMPEGGGHLNKGAESRPSLLFFFSLSLSPHLFLPLLYLLYDVCIIRQ